LRERQGFVRANCFTGANSSVNGQTPVAFNPVAIAAEPGLPASAEKARVIEIEFAAGGRMRIAGPLDASTVSALIKALARSKRRR
jgi:hypothetical protein